MCTHPPPANEPQELTGYSTKVRQIFTGRKGIVGCVNAMITSPVMSVSVSVCLSASISLEPHARSLPKFLRMLPVAVARSFSDGVTESQGEGAILGVFFPLTMHCTA